MAAVETKNLRVIFKDRAALDGVSLSVRDAELFCLLGPNGSGKSSLFRVLATLLKPSGGAASVGGFEVEKQRDKVREQIGVVFQSPSLDSRLKVGENLRHAGHLYGLSGSELARRIADVSARMAIDDRHADFVHTLSGGLKRRVEIAKCLLIRPKVLLMDEPSAGLDPHARAEMWHTLEVLRAEARTTILLTSHLFDEADQADRVAVLHEGRVVACDQPQALRSEIPGSVITIQTYRPGNLRSRISDEMGLSASTLDGCVRILSESAPELAAEISRRYDGEIRSVTVSAASLEDVFIARTGRPLE